MGVEAGVALPFYGKDVSGMGADFRDVDNDGLPDIAFVALPNETSPLFRNTGKGFFDDISPPSGLAALARPMSGYSMGMYDFDNDGWKDLFVSCGHVQSIQAGDSMCIDQHNVVFRNAEGCWSALVGEAGLTALPRGGTEAPHSPTFEGDGRVDVVITALGAPAEVWFNRSDAVVGSQADEDEVAPGRAGDEDLEVRDFHSLQTL